VAVTPNDAAAAAHVPVCPVVGRSQRNNRDLMMYHQRRRPYDEPERRVDGRMDERMGGWRDVGLDGGRHPGGCSAGRRYQQALQKIIITGF
jgi:hypothetical protein